MKLLRLREDRKVSILDDGRLELIGPQGRAVLPIDSSQARLIRELRAGVDGAQIGGLGEAEHSLIALLGKHGFLMATAEGTTRTERWIAHVCADPACSDRFAGSSIAVIGCGGTGSVIADHLARLGARQVVLVDDAILDAPDLNRQLPYAVSDVGRLKVNALGAHLRALGCDVIEFPIRLDSSDTLRSKLAGLGLAMIFCCADAPPIQVQVDAAHLALSLSCPIAFGAVGIADYVVGPLLVREQDKRAFIDRRRIALGALRDPFTISSSACINNTLAAVEQAWLGVRFILQPELTLACGLDNASTFVDIVKGTRRTTAWKAESNSGTTASARDAAGL